MTVSEESENMFHFSVSHYSAKCSVLMYRVKKKKVDKQKNKINATFVWSILKRSCVLENTRGKFGNCAWKFVSCIIFSFISACTLIHFKNFNEAYLEILCLILFSFFQFHSV